MGIKKWSNNTFVMALFCTSVLEVIKFMEVLEKLVQESVGVPFVEKTGG